MIVTERMFSCSLLTLIASSLLNHTSIRSLAVHRSLIMLRVFLSLSLFLSHLVVAAAAESAMYLIISCGWLRWTCMHIPPIHPLLFISVSQPHDACQVLNVRYTTSTCKHVYEQHYQWIWNNNNFLIIIYETFALQRFLRFMRFHVLSYKITQTRSRNHFIYRDELLNNTHADSYS